MFCPFCKLSMTTIDNALCNQVCRNWQTMDGTVEAWWCSDCRCRDLIEYTRLEKGRRIRIPGVIVITDEVLTCKIDKRPKEVDMKTIEKVRAVREGSLPVPSGTIAPPKMKSPKAPDEYPKSVIVHRTTANQLREDLLAKVVNGEQLCCPVCDQNCKMYKRKLNGGMAAALCWMVRIFDGNWIDVPKRAPRFVLRTKEYGTLRHWGLIEQKSNDDDPSKKGSGQWRPTLKGIDFVNGLTTVPKYVHLYNNHLYKVSDEQTTIREALGDKFDYEELMAGK